MRRILLLALFLSFGTMARAGNIYVLLGNSYTVTYENGHQCSYYIVSVYNDSGTPGELDDDILLASGPIWSPGCPLQGKEVDSENDLDHSDLLGYVNAFEEGDDDIHVVLMDMSTRVVAGEGKLSLSTGKDYAPSDMTEFSLAPNPAANQIEVVSSSFGILHIYSSEGSLISEIEFEGETTIDVSGYKEGLYILTFTDAETLQSTSKRFIVKH